MKNYELRHLEITIIWNWLISLKNYVCFTLDFKLKISYLLNKINEFIDKHEINYRIEEFKDSLILKLDKNNHNDSVDIVAKLINMLEPRNLI